jgi:CHASE3 domain sensor protein
MRSQLVDFLDRAGLRELGLPMLITAVVLFVAAMAMLGANVSAVRESYSRVQRSNSVLLELAAINTLVMGIDMTVRGYALTDNPDFLVYEADNRRRLGYAIDNLASFASADPGQSARIARLRPLIAQHEALFAQLSSLGPGHAKEVATAIADPAKRKMRYAVQNALTAIHNDEVKLLATRQQTAERQVSYTFDLAVGIIAFAFMAGTVGFALTLHSRRAVA